MKLYKLVKNDELILLDIYSVPKFAPITDIHCINNYVILETGKMGNTRNSIIDISNPEDIKEIHVQKTKTNYKHLERYNDQLLLLDNRNLNFINMSESSNLKSERTIKAKSKCSNFIVRDSLVCYFESVEQIRLPHYQ